MSGIPQPIASQYLSPNVINNSRTYNQQTVLNDTSSNLQTKFRQTGYIIGPPIAYSQQPILPSNFQPFSPQKYTTTVQHNSLPVIFSTNQSRSVSPARNIVTSSPIKYQPPKQINQQVRVSSHPIKYSQGDTVPRVTYQRCLSQCKNWQTKYNQLHLKYLNAATTGQNQAGLRQQNERLRQKVKQLQAKEKGFYEKLQLQFNDLVNKYRDSTMKECLLLMDRYRLQCKHAERQR